MEFFAVDLASLLHQPIEPLMKLVLMDYAQRTASRRPLLSLQALATTMRVSLRTMERTIQEMEVCGYLLVRRGKGQPTTYMAAFPPIPASDPKRAAWEAAFPDYCQIVSSAEEATDNLAVVEPGSTDNLSVAERSTANLAVVATPSTDNLAVLPEVALDSTSPPEVPSSDSEQSPSIISPKPPTKRLQDWRPFWEDFQAVYPRRRGGLDASEARKKFERLAKAGEDLAAIVAGARSYRAHCDADDKTGTEFVRQMTTWLNRRSWEDEFEPAAQPAGERFTAALNGHAPAAGPTIDPNERDDFRAQLTRCLLRQDPGEYQEVLGRYGDRLTERGLPAPAAKAALAEIEAAAGRFYAATKKTPGAARMTP